ncbi:DUF1684 domain-containing protein [Galactobacter sp.]|uniref:DUF1684 domain-containing protein n=1 Tax=Galactobacter sp. TaxID=2676125 RepID=UPI0025B90EC1|nr:DUF1684 domain-containing protein [Galactobacter sp.]
MTTTSESTSFTAEHERWHESVEAQRTSPHGPLSLTAIHWLVDTPSELPGLPGTWSATDDGTVTVTLAASDGVTRDGQLLDGTVTLGPLTGLEALLLEWGDKRIQVAARSGSIAVRPQDPASPDRANYTGTATFPADPAWVITGRYQPNPRAEVEVDSFVPGAKQQYDSPGQAHFTVDGQDVALTLFGAPGASQLRAIFADATGADLTFPAARFVPVTRDGDTVTIDFNRATNPPCAYSASATCPFPPPENRLPVRIEAGELRP